MSCAARPELNTVAERNNIFAGVPFGLVKNDKNDKNDQTGFPPNVAPEIGNRESHHGERAAGGTSQSSSMSEFLEKKLQKRSGLRVSSAAVIVLMTPTGRYVRLSPRKFGAPSCIPLGLGGASAQLIADSRETDNYWRSPPEPRSTSLLPGRTDGVTLP